MPSQAWCALEPRPWDVALGRQRSDGRPPRAAEAGACRSPPPPNGASLRRHAGSTPTSRTSASTIPASCRPSSATSRSSPAAWGAGTVHRFRMTLGGRTTQHRVRVGEPQPGHVLIESDPARRMLTTFTVDPEPYGGCPVRIETRWYAYGVRGLLERLSAPGMLRRVYRDELELLDRYAAGPGSPDAGPQACRPARGSAGVLSRCR